METKEDGIKNIDAHFADYDPQKRHVIHPWADFNGLDTHHYPAYQTGPYRWQTDIMYLCLPNFYMDFMIADKEPAWMTFGIAISPNPLFAGGFLWTYVDEAVKRTDLGGRLDSDGPNGRMAL